MRFILKHEENGLFGADGFDDGRQIDIEIQVASVQRNSTGSDEYDHVTGSSRK